MKLILTLLFGCIVLAGCKHSAADSDAYVRDHLTNAMTKFLYEQVNNDSSKVHYEIKKLYYFEEKTYFNCQFSVHMKLPTYDTTGVMTAIISKDFKTVTRRS